MKQIIKSVAGIVLFILGTGVQIHAQNLVQSLNVSLIAYDTTVSPAINIGTQRLINYFMGTNVPNGHLYLVTPMGNAPGTTGALGAFLRITSGARTIYEIPSLTQFNLYQDTAASRTNGMRITIRALNRFSFDTGSVRAELQGISNWSIWRAPVNGVDISGTGSFQSWVNGWIGIDNVTQPSIPISGTIVAGPPMPGA